MRLDAGARQLQALIDPVALGHIEHPQAAMFGEYDIPDLMLLGKTQIILGSKR